MRRLLRRPRKRCCGFTTIRAAATDNMPQAEMRAERGDLLVYGATWKSTVSRRCDRALRTFFCVGERGHVLERRAALEIHRSAAFLRQSDCDGAIGRSQSGHSPPLLLSTARVSP